MEGVSFYAGVGFWLWGKAVCACPECVPSIPLGAMMTQKPIFLSAIEPGAGIDLYCFFCGQELVTVEDTPITHRDGEAYMTVNGEEHHLGHLDEVDEVIFKDDEDDIDPEVDKKFKDIVSSM